MDEVSYNPRDFGRLSKKLDVEPLSNEELSGVLRYQKEFAERNKIFVKTYDQKLPDELENTYSILSRQLSKKYNFDGKEDDVDGLTEYLITQGKLSKTGPKDPNFIAYQRVFARWLGPAKKEDFENIDLSRVLNVTK